MVMFPAHAGVVAHAPVLRAPYAPIAHAAVAAPVDIYVSTRTTITMIQLT